MTVDHGRWSRRCISSTPSYPPKEITTCKYTARRRKPKSCPQKAMTVSPALPDPRKSYQRVQARRSRVLPEIPVPSDGLIRTSTPDRAAAVMLLQRKTPAACSPAKPGRAGDALRYHVLKTTQERRGQPPAASSRSRFRRTGSLPHRPGDLGTSCFTPGAGFAMIEAPVCSFLTSLKVHHA